MRDRILNPLRGALGELVEKRLWPVAVALVALAVAVPFLLGGSSPSETPAPSPAPASGAAPASSSVIALDGPAAVGHSRPGKVRDPIYDPPSEKTDAAAGTGAASAAPSAQATPAGTQAGGTASDTTASAPPTETTTYTSTTGNTSSDATARSVYRTEVRFGADENAKADGISRLTPLGGTTDTAALYLGVWKDAKHAAFLLAPHVIAYHGEGKCLDGDACRVVGMRAGYAVRLDVLSVLGAVLHERLEVVSVKRVALDSVDAAKKARAHENGDGRDVLREVIKDRPTAQSIGKFTYSPATGLVSLAK